MKKNKIILVCLLALFTGILPLNAATRVYHEKTRDKTDVHNFTFTESTSGFTVDLKTLKNDGLEITQQFKLHPNFSTWYWHYNCPEKNTSISATRRGNKITMSATDEGKKVKKVFDINDLAWNQTFNVGLEKFALDSKYTMKFWAIGVGGPGNLKITKFKVKRKEFQNITLSRGPESIESVHVTISLSGILSLFWTGKYWYRKSDGRFLRYKGKNKRGAPVTVMELVSSSD
ncbi:MAG: hypothetical protein GY757_52150 [bacterium]|nr:hypothetical protein [bacterium]